MSKKTLEQVKEQASDTPDAPVKAPGFFRRALNWMKGIFSKSAKAVGKLVPDRVKTFVTSVARKTGNALSYAYDYVMPPLSLIAHNMAIISALVWLGLSALLLPMAFLAVVGAGTLLFVAYAYLYAARENRIAGAILKGAGLVAVALWAGFKAVVLVLAFMGNWATSLGLVVLGSLGIYLYNVTGQNTRLEHRKVVAEAKAIVEDPSMPAVAAT